MVVRLFSLQTLHSTIPHCQSVTLKREVIVGGKGVWPCFTAAEHSTDQLEPQPLVRWKMEMSAWSD